MGFGRDFSRLLSFGGGFEARNRDAKHENLVEEMGDL
jgi:hypothetical protein